jgi:2,3-dihydroxybenzoate decarboxylase
LLNALLEVGADRILFAVDTPFEAAKEIATWFDSCSISETDRAKIGQSNAARLFGMNMIGPH